VQIVFARPSHHYDSYRIFWRLVELSGFDQIPLPHVDMSQDVFYIISPPNGELAPAMDAARARTSGPRKARTAVWDLERPDGRAGAEHPDPTTAARDVDLFAASVDHVWAFDPYYASFDSRLVRVTVGGHPGLREGAALATKAWDLCHFSYVNGRREAVMAALRARHRVGPETWGPERGAILNSSHTMAYIHQTPFPIGSPLRFALAAAYELPLMSERMENPWPMEPGWDFVQAPYEGFADSFSAWLPSADPELGRRLHKKLCMNMTFRRCVEDGVRRSLWA
jgi:hypothetical protein